MMMNGMKVLPSLVIMNWPSKACSLSYIAVLEPRSSCDRGSSNESNSDGDIVSVICKK